MKIAFVGKGGSGKTTLASLFSRFLTFRGLPVVAIDADINQHLGESLGLTQEQAKGVKPLGLEINRIKQFFRGSNPRILSNALMLKTTPPGNGSRLMRITEQNELFDYFSYDIQGVKFLATGPFDESDLGIKCYHSKVGAVELILNHTIDDSGEYMVVDMTAGADSFASGMFTRFDVTILVAEPTVKALSVYDQYKQYAADYGVKIKVIGNKIENEDDLAFIKTRVGTDYLGSISRSQYVKSLEKGSMLPLQELESENIETLDLIQKELDRTEKNWERFYEQAKTFHLKNALGWANAQLNADLTTQIDPDFSCKQLTV